MASFINVTDGEQTRIINLELIAHAIYKAPKTGQVGHLPGVINSQGRATGGTVVPMSDSPASLAIIQSGVEKFTLYGESAELVRSVLELHRAPSGTP